MFRWLQTDPLTMNERNQIKNEEVDSFGRLVLKRDLGFNNNIPVQEFRNDRAEWQLGEVKLMDNETVPHSLSSNEMNLDRPHTTDMWFIVRGGKPTSNSCHGNDTLILFDGEGG